MKVLAVCLGNICRSPMAEGIIRHKAKLAGIELETDSAGMIDLHAGEAPDSRAVKELKKYDIDISDLRARQFSVQDFDRFDYIFAMDSNNLKSIKSLTPKKNYKARVDLIMNLAYPKMNMSVPDPYYGGEDGFTEVYKMLDEAVDQFILQIKDKKEQ